jgi:tetratricopeptide (TPR) repeat protein
MRLRFRASVLGLLLALPLAPAPVRAEEPPKAATELARKRFQEGARAFSEGRFKDAIDLFLDANRVDPNPAFAYNIGLAYEELGDASNALRWYRDYLRALPDAPDRKEIEPRIAHAEQHLRERGVQQVTLLSTPPGATLTIDGQRIGVTPWTGELVPGRHAIELELRGYVDLTDEFELPSDHAVDVPVTLQAVPQAAAPTKALAPAPAPVPAEEDVHRSKGLSRVGPLTWTAFGVGAAGLGAALGLEMARSSAVDSARHSATQREGKDHYDQATSFQTASRVALGVGAAFAAAGGVLLYFDLSSDPATPKRGVSAGCGGPTCGLSFDGTF